MTKEARDDWGQAAVFVPPRSRLYRLDPIGVGTAMVESLSSYVQRVAQAHGLPPWVLVCREVAPRFERQSILTANGHCDLFGKTGITINGNNGSALEAIAVVQALTGQTMLRKMTFCPLEGLVAKHRILREKQAWCPRCIDEWRESDRTVYQPLIWMLSSLKACPMHGCLLEDLCPTCEKQHTSLGRYRWTGNCPRCSAWLGRPPRGDRRPGTTPPSSLDSFAASLLGRFVVAMQSLPNRPLETAFASNVMDLVQNRFNGNFSALARALRIHRSTASDWASSAQCPSPASLVALAYCFGGEAMDWIIGRPAPAHLHDTRPIEPTAAKSMQRPPRRHQSEIVRAHLTSATQAAEDPPLSLTAVCRRLGVDQTVAKRLCPELAAEIMSRYRLFQAEAKRTRENYRKISVESAVNQLLTEGRTLSFNQLSKVLPPGVTARDRLVRCEFQRLRAESGVV